MSDQFTWIPLYSSIADKLAEWEGRQKELLTFLGKLKAEGLPITLADEEQRGTRIAPREIDPFTFFGMFNRNLTIEHRIMIVQRVQVLLGASVELPKDFPGVPTLFSLRSWFIGFKYERGPHDVAKLWRVFRLALQPGALHDTQFQAAFDDALQVRYTSANNLTMGLFWIRPNVFLNLDKQNCKYLKIKVPAGGLTAKEYARITDTVIAQYPSLPKLSHDAWLMRGESGKNPPKPGPTPIPEQKKRDVQYWFVGAYWESADLHDQTSRFLKEGIWQDGFDSKNPEMVSSMRPGDRIAIKAASVQKSGLPFDGRGDTISCMAIKAIGTVVKNHGDGRTIDVRWEPSFETRTWYFFTYRGTIWHVKQDNENAQRLIDFTFNGAEQDYGHWGYGGAPTYGVDTILESGVFLTRDELEAVLAKWHSKKNLILQGPPGVGKTFLVHKLAYALIGARAPERVQMVQFHQSYSYEDFVQGLRPDPEASGIFSLQDGVFHRFCRRAQDDLEQKYVFIIDEINRGNLSQIFGEMLMLIEADKRSPDYAVPLVYMRANEEPFFVPSNVHIVGLMNLADRSLAMVDYALRRRFAFVRLQPQFTLSLRAWLGQRRMDTALIDRVISRMASLNAQIAADRQLGENYAIGHSFFCPEGDDFSSLNGEWFKEIVDTEIAPLLEEYWFDDRARAVSAITALLAI